MTDDDIITQQLANAGFDSTAVVPPPTPPHWTDPDEFEFEEGQEDVSAVPLDPPEPFRYDSRQSRAVQDLLDTVNARGTQYGTPIDDKANLRGALLFDIDPILGALLRANDKWVRLQNLTRERDEQGMLIIRSREHYLQIRDQMLDIAGYQIKGMEMLDERAEGGGW